MTLHGRTDDPDHFLSLLQERAPRIFEIANVGVEILFNKDSSDMAPGDWVGLARRIHELQDQWDGFVVTHGTDTMTFTACALSFMLKGLHKPVIFTGSQLPLADSRSDGPRNVIHSFEIAASGRVREVCVFFDSLLLRGNRSKKISIPSYNAFASPNYTALAKVGVHVEYQEVLPPPEALIYEFDTRIETHVVSLNLFPGINAELFIRLFDQGVKGMVLNAFGPGDVPTEDRSVVKLIEHATSKGIPTILCSQAIFGTVDLELYETGRAALRAGAISARDMTWEAVIVKTMVLLGRGLSGADFKKMFFTNLAGELSS